MADCGKDDDVVLLWSGHGYGENSQHRLITYTSPAPGQGLMSSANTIMTQELADYLIKCPARRIVVLLNTCWSGDGGQELAAVIGQAVADSLPAEQTRSMVIISSARREESVDGAFVSSVLRVLHSPGPPVGLGRGARMGGIRALPDARAALRGGEHPAPGQRSPSAAV